VIAKAVPKGTAFFVFLQPKGYDFPVTTRVARGSLRRPTNDRSDPMSRRGFLLGLPGLALALAGCGSRPRTLVYRFGARSAA
jgi:hypothetical protein